MSHSMRSISTRDLECMGKDGVGPWRLADDLLLRTAFRGRPLRTEQQAKRVFSIYDTAAQATDSLTPKAVEIVHVDEGYGVVVEYVRGVVPTAHLSLGSYTPAELGHEIGLLLRRLHAAHMNVGYDWNDSLKRWVRVLEPYVPDGLGSRLVELVDSVPASDALLHGDLHLGNMVVRSGKLALIDMECAGFGSPIIDLAIAYSRLKYSDIWMEDLGTATTDAAKTMVDALWDTCLQAYLRGTGKDELEKAELAIELLSAAERCFFTLRTGPDESRLAFYLEQVARLLREVNSLELPL